MRRYSLSLRLLKAYLDRPYKYFIDKNSSTLSTNVVSEVDQLVVSSLRPLFALISQTIIAVAILIVLVVLEPVLALYACLLLGGLYGIIYFFIKNFITRIGKERFNCNAQRYQIVNEVFSGIKAVKISGAEEIYTANFRKPATFCFFIYHEPDTCAGSGYVVELIAFGGILIMTLGFLFSDLANVDNGLSFIIPTLSLFAFAAYRLRPAAQAIFIGVGQLKFTAEAIKKIHKDLVWGERMKIAVSQWIKGK